jgi:hydroxymethylbilane synthase
VTRALVPLLRIGTRKSALALWQAERVKEWLEERGHACELVPMSTEGDRILDRSLAEVGGKGLFVKELEQAILEARADLAVHSAKDVPFALPERLVLSAFPVREDPRDALVAPVAKTFDALPRGARVGTSSLRRGIQLLAARPDLVVVPVRGNVQTRLARATGGTVVRGGVEVRPAEGDPQGPLDAVVLALAGLRRLGLERHVTQVLPVTLSLPAAGQGALAIEVLRGSPAFEATAPLDDETTSRCVRAERALLARLSGGCTVPVAAYAVPEDRQLWLRATLGGPDGEGVRLVHAEGRGGEPESLGRSVGEALLAQGGAALLEAARSGASGLPAPKRT